MQAQVISMMNRKDITDNNLCNCGCGQPAMPARPTSQIWAELRQLPMGQGTREQEELRADLVAELQQALPASSW